MKDRFLFTLIKPDLISKAKISENLTQAATHDKMDVFWKNMSRHINMQFKAPHQCCSDLPRKKLA